MECAKAAGEIAAQPAVRPRAGRPADDLPEHRRARLHRRRRWCGEAAERAACATAARSTRRPPACPRCARRSRAGTPQRFGARHRAASASSSPRAHRPRCSSSCLALVDPGDEVLMPDPSYPCNRHFVAAAGGRARAAAGRRPSTRFQLDADAVRAAWGRAHARRAAGLAVQPHRHVDRARRDARASSSAVRARGGFTHRRRDLPRPELRRALRPQRADAARRRRHRRSTASPSTSA